ncbi:four-carbon acid sugar kinase family protein [Microlunatus panaciterrae]|uniref:Uncharacterized protein YgbK (DUF1537 family) n=1 Tax=Microlunatus panaciterrae TaxID=400768 RepID=A0ABS2RFT7_9ACTN|nr:four-carbon acid sugar kinase family protein [Microlunatus panaciterrae]MBM7797865.1 uncharacterized protein YgbK (DUF1537 family) [Microlunatus panaciterrae]
MLEAEVLAAFPPEVEISAESVAASVAETGRILVVLDDDPTGTQSVADLPVLTSWEVGDFRWALSQGAAAVYVLTNTRSLDAEEARRRVREVVTNALLAADGVDLGFVSRSDSTLRGHFPLEPEVIADALRAAADISIDGVVIVPAFPDAGRITIGGTHYVRAEGGRLIPVARTEFAQDATFGFTRSNLAEYVEEKSAGRYRAEDVVVLDLTVIRGGAAAVADRIDQVVDAAPIVSDAVTENDLRALALGLAEAERRGKRLLYRVGPPFVRARIGQRARSPLTRAEILIGATPAALGGVIVVGSHVGQTTRQLQELNRRHPQATTVELEVPALMEEPTAGQEIARVVDDVVSGLEAGDVILHTSRLLVRGGDAAESLRIARTVSAVVEEVMRRVLQERRPRFVIAKGGITSSDVATRGLQIRHAMVRGPMLPGIVSLWEPVDGPAQGIPYVVFAGNVGDDSALADVVHTLSGALGDDPTGGRPAR